ncbi:MAG: hypothetical protein ACOH1Y_14295 [Propionicimonas sp.]
MKVKIEVTIDVDPASWTLNYGTAGASAIRDDVKVYVQDLILSQLGPEGVDVLTGHHSPE